MDSLSIYNIFPENNEKLYIFSEKGLRLKMSRRSAGKRIHLSDDADQDVSLVPKKNENKNVNLFNLTFKHTTYQEVLFSRY